jgi:hypothetical protein
MRLAMSHGKIKNKLPTPRIQWHRINIPIPRVGVGEGR